MQGQANPTNNTRPVLPRLQTSAHPHSVPGSSVRTEIVDSILVGRQPPPPAHPAHTLPTPPYSSWGTRDVPNASIGSSSHSFAPSTFVDTAVGEGRQIQMRRAQRRESGGQITSLRLTPASATPTTSMASNNPPVSAGAFDFLANLQGQAGQHYNAGPSHPPRQPTQIAHDPGRQTQMNVQRASGSYIPQQPQRVAPPAGQPQGFAGQVPSMYSHSLPYHAQIQLPAQGPSTASNRPPVPPTQGNIPHSSAAVTSRPSSSASHPHSSPHIPSPIGPSHQLHPAPTRQQHPSASTGMQGNIPLLPTPQRAPQPASSFPGQVPAQQQRPQQPHQPHQPRVLPPEHPAMQRAQEILRYTTSHLEKAYNYALYGVSSELDRLNEQYWAECKRLQDLYRRAEQEKTAVREECNKWFGELVTEKAAHDVTRAQCTKASNTAKHVVAYLQNSAPQVDAMIKENKRLKAENELLNSANRHLIATLFDRESSQSTSLAETQSKEPVNMVQLGQYSVPHAVLSLLERAVKEPLIQQYEQRLAEALVGQLRGSTSREPAPSRVHPSETLARPPQEPPALPAATPLTPSEPTPREPPTHVPAGPAQSHLATPNPESPAPRPQVPLSLGPSLSRRRDPQPMPLTQLQRSSSIVPPDTHSDSIPSPPRTATPSEPLDTIPSMFSVKEEPVETPLWPWAAGEIIDLTGLSDSPLPADLTPLPLDLGQLEIQFGGGGEDAMDVDAGQPAADIRQSDGQNAPQAPGLEPASEPERKRPLDDDLPHDETEGESARKKLKVEQSTEEEEEDAVMEELEPSTGREVDELTQGMTSTQPTTPPSPIPVLEPGPPEPDPTGTGPAAAEPTLPLTVEEDQPAVSDQDLHHSSVPSLQTSSTGAPLPDPILPDVPALPSVPEPQLALAFESIPGPILEPSMSVQIPPPPIPPTAEVSQPIIKPEPQDPSLPGGRSASPKLSVRHLALIYHTDQVHRIMTCRMCLQRKRYDPEWTVKRLPSSASWDDLSGHCRNVHPRSITKLLEMSDAKLQETRQRLITSNC